MTQKYGRSYERLYVRIAVARPRELYGAALLTRTMVGQENHELFAR